MNTTKLIIRFNQKAKEWMTELENYDERAIHLRPIEGSWSVSEVYDHVMRVTRSYQIPNLKSSLTESAKRKKRKNKYGIAVFNLGIRKNIHMKMEEFPTSLVSAFTPVQRNKDELVQDFASFILEVNGLQDFLMKSNKRNKQYHPMFGDIDTTEWFALIELHMWQHDKQRRKLKSYLESMR